MTIVNRYLYEFGGGFKFFKGWGDTADRGSAKGEGRLCRALRQLAKPCKIAPVGLSFQNHRAKGLRYCFGWQSQDLGADGRHGHAKRHHQ